MGTRKEVGVSKDLKKDGWSAEVDGKVFILFFIKMWVVGSEERMWKIL